MVRSIEKKQTEWVVGDPRVLEVSREALKKSIQKGNASSLSTPVSLNAHKMVVLSEMMDSLDVNRDGFEDVIQGRAYRIGHGTKESPYKWETFTAVYFGSPDKQISKNADVLLAEERQKLPDTVFWLHSAQAYIEDQSTLDAAVARGIEKITTFAYNSRGYLELVEATQANRSADAKKLRELLETKILQEFQFALPALERAVAMGLTSPLYAQRLKNIADAMRRQSFLPENKQVELVEALNRANRLWNETNTTASMACDDLYGQFLYSQRNEASPASEATYLKGNALKIKNQSHHGGLFDENGFIALANQAAQEQGYANYAELKMREIHDMSVEEYRNVAENMLAENRPEMDRILKDIRSVFGANRNIHENNIYELLTGKMKKRLGDNEPTLSVSEAVEVAKHFFKDLGFDLDNLPGSGEIILDVHHREGKYDAYQVTLEDGKYQWLIYEPGEDNRFTLVDLSQLIHELGHAVHFYLASLKSGGSSLNGPMLSSKSWIETVGTAFEGLVFSDQWIDRYLSKYNTFKDETKRRTVGKEYRDNNVWWTSIMAARALWEINLYEDRAESGAYRTMEERLRYWDILREQYFGYEGVGVPASVSSVFNLSYMHPTWMPMQYPSYTAGQSLATTMMVSLKTAIEREDVEGMKKAFGNISTLLEAGGAIFSVQDAQNYFNPNTPEK